MTWRTATLDGRPERDVLVVVRGPFTKQLYMLRVRYLPGDRGYAPRVVHIIALCKPDEHVWAFHESKPAGWRCTKCGTFRRRVGRIHAELVTDLAIETLPKKP